jgi:bacterial/archaeal transporter family protein
MVRRLTALAHTAMLPCMNWIVWALLSAFFAGITAILAKIGVAGVDSNLATAVRTTVVLAFTRAIALSTSPVASLWRLSNRTLVFLALSGMATGLSWLCYFRALQLGQASRVAPVDKLSVVFAILLAAVVLGEQLKWQHYLGGALIVSGAVILAWS